jgi:IS5 family transposase
MNPVLSKIDHYLEDEQLFQLVKQDLSQRWLKTLFTGRNTTPVEVSLRMLVIKRLYQYSYEETERCVSDSLVLRKFCRIYLNPVPDDTTLIRTANLIRSETLVAFNARITELTIENKVTKGKKLRTDGTVVESNIHAPSDNRHLADSVRVLSRNLRRAGELIKDAVQVTQDQAKNMNTAAKRHARKIGETLRKRTDEALASGQKMYTELLEITKSAIHRAKGTLPQLRQTAGKTAKHLTRELEKFTPLAEKVVQQTKRRILENEKVPAQEKIVSIFEPHADIICRGKEDHPVEYGHKVWLDEVDGGIVTHYRILVGNPSDEKQWKPSLEAHIETFKHPPEQASADRGLFSAQNETTSEELGVIHSVLPQKGYRSKERLEHEHRDWFVAGRKWHAGIEGRISVLKRAHGLGSCLNHGLPGFEGWVGWGVIAGNLAVIGRNK